MRTIAMALSIALGATASTLPSAPSLADADMVTSLRAEESDFDAVRFGIESAIENRGYVIDYHARVGEMLERTAADIGADASPYSNAETWQFCSAILSRQMVDADPANIAHCPFVVYAYETREEPGVVVVGFRPHADDGEERSRAALEAIDRELAEIVAEALR